MPDPAAAFADVAVTLGGRVVLGPLDWTVSPGERWAVLGPNGAGKTTLLSLLGAERHPSSGAVTVLGERLGRTDLRQLRRRIGTVGHLVADRLPRHASALEIVLTGSGALLAPWWGEFSEATRTEARRLLQSLRCAHVAEQPFGACSQGERQRVLLARALLARAELLILDEPAIGVDLPGREALVLALDELAASPAAPTTVHVAHTLEELPAITHALLLRAGRVVAVGAADAVLTDEALSETYGIEVKVRREGQRFYAQATGRW